MKKFYLVGLLGIHSLFALERESDLGDRADFAQLISQLQEHSTRPLCSREELSDQECDPLIRLTLNKQKFDALFLNSPWIKRMITTPLQGKKFSFTHSAYPEMGRNPSREEENWKNLSITEKLSKGALPISKLEEKILQKALTSYGLEGEDNTSSWNPATRLMASQMKSNLSALTGPTQIQTTSPAPLTTETLGEQTSSQGLFSKTLTTAWKGVTSVVGVTASAGRAITKATVDLSSSAAMNYFNSTLLPTQIALNNVSINNFDFSDLKINQKVDANNNPQYFISVKVNKIGIKAETEIKYLDFKEQSMKRFDQGRLNISYDKSDAPFVINIPLVFDGQGELSYEEFVNKKMSIDSKFPFENTNINYDGNNETLKLVFQHIDHGNIGKDLKQFFVKQSLDNAIGGELVKSLYKIDQIKEIMNNKFTLSDFMPKRFTDDQRVINLENKIKNLSDTDNDIVKGKEFVKNFMEGVEYPFSETMVQKVGELYLDAPILFEKYDSIIKQMMSIVELNKKNEQNPLSVMPEITNDLVNSKSQHLNFSLKRTQCRSPSKNIYLGDKDAVIDFDFNQINKKLQKLHQENRLDFCLMLSSKIRSCKNAKLTNIASKIKFDKAPKIEWDKNLNKNVIVFKGVQVNMNGLLRPINWTPFNKFDLKIALNPKSGSECQGASLSITNNSVCIAPEIVGPKPTMISTIMGSDFLSPIFDTIFHPAVVQKLVNKFTLEIPTGTYNVDLPSHTQMLQIGRWKEKEGKMRLDFSFNREFLQSAP